MSATYTISHKAYVKITLHAAKHPHLPVNGVLLGTFNSGKRIIIADAVPLLHHWTSLSPMMEIGLDLAKNYSQSIGLAIVGYYQAGERLDDTVLAPVGERIASKLREAFPDAIALVVDSQKFGTDDNVLVPYLPQSPSPTASWKPSGIAVHASPTSPTRALKLVREDRLQDQFGDFDDHLEDVTIDWLRNVACGDDEYATSQ